MLENNISHNNKTKYEFSCLTAVQHWYANSTTGQTKVINYDASGLIINNPKTADRDYFWLNYDEFVGFFQVTPLNYIYNYSGLTSIEPCTTLETAKLSFDPDKSELPDCAKVASVKKGMTMEEVNSVLGKPQRQITSGVLVVEYDLSNGEKLVVEYTLVGSALEVYSYQMEA